jgi:hypothetical protein
MAIGMLLEIPGGTREEYEAVNDHMFGAQQPDQPPEGLVLHTAGPTSDGWRIFDVWESAEALQRFNQEQVMPALEELGFTRETRPQIYELHNVIKTEKAAV